MDQEHLVPAHLRRVVSETEGSIVDCDAATVVKFQSVGGVVLEIRTLARCVISAMP
jgi:hypothetical protein